MSTTDHSSESLLSALSKVRVPVENHDFVGRITRAVGIVGFEAVDRSDKPFVRATRRDGGPDLHIHYGFTTGFVDEEEVIRVAGRGAGRAASSRKGTWYVTHPTNQVRPAGERSQTTRREPGFCTCGMQLTLTGICDSCE